jgi:D-alanine-D-alanine ligase
MSAVDVRSLGKVAVLMGGQSAEREISLMSGGGVLQALQGCGVDAHAFDPAERSLWELKTEGFDRCFIALHGRFGEDGTVQGALELMGIPYTGSGVMASSLAIDKAMTKRLWLAQGLSTPGYVLLRGGRYQAADLHAVIAELGLPLIVKPAREGSSIGLTKVSQANQMAQPVSTPMCCASSSSPATR